MLRSKPWKHVVELQLQQTSRLERAQIALFEVFWQSVSSAEEILMCNELRRLSRHPQSCVGIFVYSVFLKAF